MKVLLEKNKHLMLRVMCAVVAALLFVFGGDSAEAGTTVAMAAAVALTDEEKSTFNEQEQKMILAVKKLVAQSTEDAKKGTITSEEAKGIINDVTKGLRESELKALSDQIEALKTVNETQETRLKAQGTALKALQEGGGPLDILSLEKALTDNMSDLKKFRAQKSGAKNFYFGDYEPTPDEKGSVVTGIKSMFTKDPVNMTVANTTSSSPTSVTNPYSPYPTQVPNITFLRRSQNLALNFVDVGSTNSSVMTWTEEVGQEGSIAVVAEGALKPQVSFTFQDKITKAKKAAGWIKITEEMENNIPRIVTAIRRLFQEKVMRAYDDLIYTDIITAAPGYAYTGLDDAIENADNYGAIAAAIAQIESLNYNPDLLVLNPADRWKMRLQKGTDGHYVLPPFEVNGQSFDGLRVIISNKVAVGNFLVGESNTWKVDEYKPYSLTIGWVNDDLIRNQYTAVGEVWFHSYIATADLAGWVYASFATVKAAIETP